MKYTILAALALIQNVSGTQQAHCGDKIKRSKRNVCLSPNPSIRLHLGLRLNENLADIGKDGWDFVYIIYMLANTVWIATAVIHRLPIRLHDLQLPFDFLVDFLQFILGDILDRPSDDQTTVVGFLRFGDDVEVDVINDLGDH